jgi:hypothetical protein
MGLSPNGKDPTSGAEVAAQQRSSVQAIDTPVLRFEGRAQKLEQPICLGKPFRVDPVKTVQSRKFVLL